MNISKFIPLLAAACIAAAPAQAIEKPQIINSGDTTTLIAGNDTVQIAGTNSLSKAISSVLEEEIKKKFNDTVYATEENGEVVADDNDEATDSYDTYRMASMQAENQMVKMIILFVFTALVLCVLIISIAAYKMRRAKYRVIEKAIDNNYTLPNGFVTGIQPVQPMSTPAPQTETQSVPNQWNTHAPAAAKVFDANVPLSWPAYKKSILLIIIGFAMVMFFVCNDVPGMAFLCSSVMLYGLAKAFFTYQSLRNQAYYSQQCPPAVPSQPQAPQQPAATADQPEQSENATKE